MKTVTARQMQELDQRAIREYGMPSLLLMENAGRGVAELIFQRFRSVWEASPTFRHKEGGSPPADALRRISSSVNGGAIRRGGTTKVTVFCGKGNNGGDGLVTARHLHNRGFSVYVLLFAKVENLKDDPAVNFHILSKMKIPYLAAEENAAAKDFLPVVERSDVIVDSLFGVGLERPVTGFYAAAIQAINQAGRNVVAVDLPSGLHSDTGEVLGIAVKASLTATLGIPKQGLFQGEGPKLAGKICVVDIGLPKELIRS